MKKRYLFLLLFLLLVPLTGIKAISWGILKDIDTPWRSGGMGYGCYFLRNGEGQDGNYSITPTYTYSSHTYNTNRNTGHSNDGYNNYDDRCFPGKMYAGSGYDSNFEGGKIDETSYVGLYPLTGETGCKLLPDQFKKNRKSDSVADCHDGGCTSYYYDKWSDSSTVSLTECIAATMLAGSDLGEYEAIENNIMVEAKKNSDFLSSEDMEKMKAYDSSFNDDTEFCFVRGHYGDEYATYFGHVYADLTFDEEYFKDYDTEDSYNRIKISFPSSMPNDDAFGLTIFPNINKAMEILELKELKGEMQDNDSLIVLNKGKLVTDSTLCSKEVIDAFINNDEEAIDALDDRILKDVIDGDFQWWLNRGYKKSKAIDVCMNLDATAGTEKCYRYTFSPTIGHPMYNTTVWSSRPISCGFVETTWTYDQCKDGSIAGMYQEKITVTKTKKDTTITTTYDRKITKSGYNGVADFFDKTDKSESGYKCSNFKVLHIIYRAFIIFAPIMTILFVSFDLVSSLISGDAQKVKKFRDKLFRRIIALVLLIVIPIIINVLVNTLSKNNFIKDKSVIKCVVLGK